MENLNEYLEVHYDIVEYITEHLTAWRGDDNWSVILKRHEQQGRCGMYELAKEWTDDFMKKYKDITWGEDLEYYETIEEFLDNKSR